MDPARLKTIISKGEGLTTELKEARDALPRNLFETVCAFLNRTGGSLILGVADDKTIKGIEESKVDQFKNEIITLSNNPQKLDPPFILYPVSVEIAEKTVIHIQIPQSSQVHNTKGIVYDRGGDGDFKVTDPGHIADLHNLKNRHYSENEIFPALTSRDLNPETFKKVRNLIYSRNPDHSWLALDDHQLLERGGLFRKDQKTGEKGYTLAAALLFGTDATIQSILPHYKIDCLIRRENPDRYDDRIDIRTNIVDAYDLLITFINRYFPDKFHLQDGVRVNLREQIFREIIANLIIHREYTSAHSARLSVFSDKVEVINANNPHGSGPIDIHNFVPFPKNPTLTKFFIQLGRAEEIGSGITNIHKYLPIYFKNAFAEFIEGPEFTTIIHFNLKKDFGGLNEGINEGINGGLNEKQLQVLELIQRQKSVKTKDVVEMLQMSVSTAERLFKKLKDNQWITFKGPKKTGKYELTDIGFQQLKSSKLDGISGGLNDGINSGISSEHIQVLEYIHTHQGSKTKDIAKTLQISVRNAERILKKLKDNSWIIFSGTKKAGSYLLTKTGIDLLKLSSNKK